MNKFISSIILLTIIFISVPYDVSAAKKFLPQKTATRAIISKGSIPSLVKYRTDRLGILLSFTSFNGIDSVNYSFTYNSNNGPQGAGGTIRSTNNPTSQRELLFGTCSTSVCTYHSGLSNARLVLTAKMTNGRTVTKTYKIKTYR